MSTYLLSFNVETSTNDYWIDAPKPYRISAANVQAAIKEYIADNDNYIEFSKSAFKHKDKIYHDTNTGSIHCGYVITASTQIEDNYKWKKKYLRLWITVDQIINPFDIAV